MVSPELQHQRPDFRTQKLLRQAELLWQQLPQELPYHRKIFLCQELNQVFIRTGSLESHQQLAATLATSHEGALSEVVNLIVQAECLVEIPIQSLLNFAYHPPLRSKMLELGTVDILLGILRSQDPQPVIAALDLLEVLTDEQTMHHATFLCNSRFFHVMMHLWTTRGFAQDEKLAIEAVHRQSLTLVQRALRYSVQPDLIQKVQLKLEHSLETIRGSGSLSAEEEQLVAKVTELIRKRSSSSPCTTRARSVK